MSSRAVLSSRAVPRTGVAPGIPFAALSLLFFLSGFAALIYQVVWQRALFAIYGLDVTSVTIVVSAFMLGLGVGSLVGGFVARDPGRPLVAAFALMELGIAAFGLVSLDAFRWVGSYTATASGGTALLVCFAILLLPTSFMGASLPLLVAHSVGKSGNVGRSVGGLYFANTLGGAAAAWVSAMALLARYGPRRSVILAAGLNALVGLAVLGYQAWIRWRR